MLFVERGGSWGRLITTCLLGMLMAPQLTRAQANSLETRICIFDARDAAPLFGAAVQVGLPGEAPVPGTTGADGCARLTVFVAVDTDDDRVLPEAFSAGAPYPNPTADRAVIPFVLNRPAEVIFELYDVLGRALLPASPHEVAAGPHSLEVQIAGLSSGVYFYRLRGAQGAASGRIIKTGRRFGGEVTLTVQPQAGVSFAGKRRTAYRQQAPAAGGATVHVTASMEGFVTETVERQVEPGETVNLFLLKVVAERMPLIDMEGVAYLGFEGGLYPEGRNTMPARHDSVGRARAARLGPLNAEGNPDPKGTVVLLSIGMSNASREFCGDVSEGSPCSPWTFIGQAASLQRVNKASLVIVNGATGGEPAKDWEAPTDRIYNRVRNRRLAAAGVAEAQVQVVWLKQANAHPSVALPDDQADAVVLERRLGNIVRTLKVRYPNLQLIFLSSRIYAGYATSTLNPEPYAYESGFSVKWLIEAQIRQMERGEADPVAGDLNYNTTAPWLAWGPYLWANGLNPRSDGLIWERGDFDARGTHPGSGTGEKKVAELLLAFFEKAPYTRCWFLEDGAACDINGTAQREAANRTNAWASPSRRDALRLR